MLLHGFSAFTVGLLSFYSFLKYITISHFGAKDYSAWSFRYSARPSS